MGDWGRDPAGTEQRAGDPSLISGPQPGRMEVANAASLAFLGICHSGKGQAGGKPEEGPEGAVGCPPPRGPLEQPQLGRRGREAALRSLEDASQAAADEEAELLREEDPGDLREGALRLAAQVQQGGPQEGDAEAEAEEDAPVGQRGLQVPLEERRHPRIPPPHPRPGRPLATAPRQVPAGGRAGAGDHKPGTRQPRRSPAAPSPPS